MSPRMIRFPARALLALGLCASLVMPVTAQQTTPRPVASSAAVEVDRSAWLYEGSDIPRDAGWQFGTLSNGLRFAVRRNGVPPGQVTIRLRVDAGSMMERPEESGWAHLIEHLAFRESRYLPSGEARRAWQRLGVSFGSDSNASTGPTATIYQLDIPAATPEAVMQSMQYLSGMIREPVLTDATVAAERPIVIAERRERDGPQFRIETASREHLFAGQLLAQRSTIGTEATLQAANGAGVSEFHRRWYRPERVVIAIAGDLDPALLERSITSHFADWRATGAAPQEPDFGRPDGSQPVGRVIVEPSQPMVASLAWVRPWTRVTDSVEWTQGLMLDTLATLVINRKLEERAREGGSFLAAQVQEDRINRSAWVTTLTVIPIGDDWNGAIDDARSVVADALASPVSETAIMREFADVETFLARELANAQNEPGTKQADDLLNAVDIGETVTSPDHALTIWRSIRALATPATILARTRVLFSGDAQRAMLTTPRAVEGGETALAEAFTRPARSLAAVDTGPVPTFADLPAPRRAGSAPKMDEPDRFGLARWEFANGVTAMVRDTNIEPDKIRIRIRWGAGRRGLSPTEPNLLWSGEGALVESGIGRYGQSQLDRLVNGRQIGMSFEVDDDAFEFSAETNRADFADQMRLLVSKFMAPGWAAAPVQRLRSGLLLSYDTLRSSPMAVIENELEHLLYARDTRFGQPDRAAIEALTPQSFRAFWEPVLAAGPIEVQLFGDMSGIDVAGVMASTFGGLPRRNVLPAAALADVRPAAPAADPITVTHNGGGTQAAIIINYPTGGGLDNIRTARQLEILAAIFNDRLYERLRDRAGASYSQAVVSNWPMAFPSGGHMFVAGLVRPEDSQLMVDAASAIAAELVAAPVSADELQRAVGPAAEQIIRASSGNVFWMIQSEGGTRDPRRMAALQSYLADLTQVTPADLQTLARRYLAGDRAVQIRIVPATAAAGSDVAP